jgi:cardiolipin synthase C
MWIQTPYLVLSELGLSVFQKAEERGVEVKILTNSLASTDNYPAFAGYKKIRQDLKDIGVEVYEMKPYAPDVMALNTSGVPDKMDAKVGLHSKSLLIDDHISMIGSFNLDPRSANLNTECIVIVRDEKITKEMAGYFEREMSEENAWPSDPKNEKYAPIKDRIFTWFSKWVPEEIL